MVVMVIESLYTLHILISDNLGRSVNLQMKVYFKIKYTQLKTLSK